MADRVVLTPGVLDEDLVGAGLLLTGKAGTCLLTAMPRMSQTSVPMFLVDMIQFGKQLKGLLYGGMNPRTSTPMLLSLYQDGAAQARRTGDQALPARADQRRDQ